MTHVSDPPPWIEQWNIATTGNKAQRLAAIRETLVDGCDIAMLPLVMKRISTEPDARIRRELVRKLDVFGVHAIEPMLDLLGSTDAEISTLHALLITLLRRSKREALPIITQAIQGRTARRQLGAVTALVCAVPTENGAAPDRAVS